MDKESHTLAIICQDLSVVLAFDNRERLIQWSVRISNNLGEGHQFLVQLASAPSKSKLTPGPVKLHVTDRKFCLTGGIPPRLLGSWEVSHLRYSLLQSLINNLIYYCSLLLFVIKRDFGRVRISVFFFDLLGGMVLWKEDSYLKVDHDVERGKASMSSFQTRHRLI